jgi:hypothetical protein
LVVIAGVQQKAHYLVMDLPHSDDCFVAAFPAETTEAFLEDHVRAFAYFGGVPTCILYDNTKIAVANILGGEDRQRTPSFSELKSFYLFADKFGRPAKGNDKGKVEAIVGNSRRNFMVPIPRASSWEELNAHPESDCRNRASGGCADAETIGERLERGNAAMLPLPVAPYEACEKIACASEAIVRHKRSYEREAVVFDPLHYLALLEQKTRALDQASPLAGWQLPECFAQQRRLIEARLKKNGSREYNYPPYRWRR